MECGGKRSATPLGLCFCGTKPASAMECGGKRSATPLWLVFLRYKTSLCHGVRRQAQRDAALACVCVVSISRPGSRAKAASRFACRRTPWITNSVRKRLDKPVVFVNNHAEFQANYGLPLKLLTRKSAAHRPFSSSILKEKPFWVTPSECFSWPLDVGCWMLDVGVWPGVSPAFYLGWRKK